MPEASSASHTVRTTGIRLCYVCQWQTDIQYKMRDDCYNGQADNIYGTQNVVNQTDVLEVVGNGQEAVERFKNHEPGYFA